MQLFKSLEDAITRYGNNKAFCINNNYYTYRDLATKISGIRYSINANGYTPGKSIGLVTNNDLETYAAIIAIWFEGHFYVPIDPQMPAERNEEIIRLAGIHIIIDSSETALFLGYPVIHSNKVSAPSINLVTKTVSGDELAYTVFTSGSTGTPKGVPITISNLTTFVNSFSLLGLDLDESDRCLQMFELTFDLSVMSYLIPLLKGACIYTVPKNQIKYSYIFKLLDEHDLTVALMIPTIIHYLRPYFDEIDCRNLKYNLFCGEALPLDVTEAWSRCIPNAKILNVYGPSEATIFCTHYLFDRAAYNKTQNGILSIGKPMEGTHTIIVNEENYPVKVGETGELCLSGMQLTPGYLNDETRNNSSFFNFAYGGNSERFYKTGDLCFMDSEGDIMYIGRIDSQVKIQGYRVELTEVEFYVKAYLVKTNALALAFTNKSESREIGLLIEGEPFDTTGLIAHLKIKIPFYMVPTRIMFEKVFPQNNNGKTDRKELLKRLQQ